MLRTHLLFGLLVLVASLNRETGVLLVVAHGGLCLVYRRPRWLLWTAAYGVLWLACVIGVRLAMGSGDTYWTVGVIATENARRFPEAVMHTLILFGGFWVFVVEGLRRLPRFHVALLPVLIASLLLTGVFGIWSESRLLVPLYPLLLSYGLIGMQADDA